MESERCRRLTRQQIACLRLVADGLSSKEIAARLDLQPGTIDQYLKDASAILGTRTRSQAAVVYMRFLGTEVTPKSELQPQDLARVDCTAPFSFVARTDADSFEPAGRLEVREERSPYGEPPPALDDPSGGAVDEGGERTRLGVWQKAALIAALSIFMALAVTGLVVAMRAVGEMFGR